MASFEGTERERVFSPHHKKVMKNEKLAIYNCHKLCVTTLGNDMVYLIPKGAPNLTNETMCLYGQKSPQFDCLVCASSARLSETLAGRGGARLE